MAIKLVDEYVNVGPPDANYPGGSFRNTSGPTSTDGTPFEQAWANDVWGFLSALLAQSGVVPSGVPDTAITSQYLTALQKVVGIEPELLDASSGGINVNLPASGVITYLRTDDTDNTIIISPSVEGQTVMRQDSIALDVKDSVITLKLIGTNWFAI